MQPRRGKLRFDGFNLDGLPSGAARIYNSLVVRGVPGSFRGKIICPGKGESMGFGGFGAETG